ncbi:MAG: AarF/ABC1/UbiB kinase family protein [Acidimicrobiales bacterium]|nr:AarF/ABC1/UbiB kinase family protein [Acidimicrobiales bacterium]
MTGSLAADAPPDDRSGGSGERSAQTPGKGTPLGKATSRDGRADLAVGAFTPNGPWTVELDRMAWRSAAPGRPDVDTRRRQAADEARRLVSSSVRPRPARAAAVVVRIGGALLLWRLRERGTERSRAGLSRRLRRAFERLGPTYIKLGQILSSGEGVFPDELVAEFRLLRDRVRPEPFSVVRRTVESELGRPLADTFLSFDPIPIASASIAQVHAATLRSGERVAVKVQRSTVDRLVRLDLAVMAWLAPVLVGRIPVAALTNPPALVDLFAETIVEELDFRLEAQNMLDIAAVYASSDQRAVVVPRPHPTLVTRRVLVMEHLSGFAWGDASAMQAAGIDTAAVLRATLIAFLEGALLHGVFHGDLHGGNLLVRRDGTVALLDFGITGRLDERGRLGFLRLEMGATTNDIVLQVQALRDLGALPPEIDVDAVIHDLGLDRPPVDPTTLTADEMVAELREITKGLLEYGARMPKELMLFVKDVLFLNGAMATMAPDVDIMEEIMAVATYFTERYGARIAAELGMEVSTDAIDLDGYRAALGFPDERGAITFEDLQERRELIRRRLEHRHETERSRRGWRRFGRRGPR